MSSLDESAIPVRLDVTQRMLDKGVHYVLIFKSGVGHDLMIGMRPSVSEDVASTFLASSPLHLAKSVLAGSDDIARKTCSRFGGSNCAEQKMHVTMNPLEELGELDVRWCNIYISIGYRS